MAVTIKPTGPELERLEVAAKAYEAALDEAIAALTLRRTTLSNIAFATKAPRKRIKLGVATAATTAHPTHDSPPDGRP